MKYEPIEPISKEKAEVIFNSGEAHEIEKALTRLAYHYKNWRWVQAKCLFYVENGNDGLQQTAILCLGHLARIHRQLDLEIVIPLLEKLKSQNNLQGQIEDALDDIDIYTSRSNKLDT